MRPGREPVFASLPLGVLTLSQARPLGDPPHAGKVAALKEELAARLGFFLSGGIGPIWRETLAWWAPPGRSRPWRPCS